MTAALIIVVIAALLVLFASRGGREEEAARNVRTVTFYGDSATRGGYFVDGALRHYAPDPVERVALAAEGKLQCLNRAMNGLQLRELLTGGPVAMVAPGLGEPDTTRSFAELLADDPSETVVIGCGNVDALFGALAPPDFYTLMVEAIDTARRAGKIPVVRGLNLFLLAGPLGDGHLARRDEFDRMARQAAENRGVQFLDITLAGEPTLCVDQLHPDENYHDRIARVIATQLQ